MSFDNDYTAVTGATYTAAQYNTHTRDNFTAIFVYTQAGSIAYSTSATTLAELKKPSVLSALVMDSGGIPVWLALTNLGGIHAKAQKDYNASDQHISSTSYTDITNASHTIVTTTTCTIILIARGVFAVGAAGGRAFVQGVIGASGSGDSGAPHTSSAYYVPFALTWYKTGVPAGTITCKLQGRANTSASADVGIFERGHLDIYAFAE